MIRRKSVAVVYFGGPYDGKREVLTRLSIGCTIEFEERVWSAANNRFESQGTHVYEYQEDTRRLIYRGHRAA